MSSNKQSSSSLGKNPRRTNNKIDDNPKSRKIQKPTSDDNSSSSFNTINITQQSPTILNVSSYVPTLEDLNTFYDHEQTIHLLKEKVPLSNKQITKTIQKDKEDDGEYPIEALIGSHLITAIDEYNRHADKSLAFKAMVKDLMVDDKVTSQSVAKLVANWLCNTFTHQSLNFSPYSDSPISDNPPPMNYLFEWLEIHLKVNLKNSFDSLVDKPYNPPKEAIQGFYNRKDFKHSIEELVNKNLTHFHTNKKGPALRRDSFSYGILTNGTGNGKSRACNEIQNIILNMQVKQTNVKYRKLHSYISLDNGSSITSLESKINLNNEKTEGKIIGIRLLAKILGINTGILVEKLGIHFTSILNTDFFTLDNIVNKFKEFMNENEILIWSISFDEVQNLCHYFKDQWKLPFYSIGKFMVNTESINENLNSNICLIPILSEIKYDLTFSPTECYGNQELSLL